MLGPLEWYMMPTLDAALLCSSSAGSDLGHNSANDPSHHGWTPREVMSYFGNIKDLPLGNIAPLMHPIILIHRSI